MESVTLSILCMAVITFFVRYAFFARTLPIKLNRHAKQFLFFTGACILTAMWVPIVMMPTLAQKTMLNPYLIAGVLSVLFSLFIRHTLVVIILSMACFYGLRFVLAG